MLPAALEVHPMWSSLAPAVSSVLDNRERGEGEGAESRGSVHICPGFFLGHCFPSLRSLCLSLAVGKARELVLCLERDLSPSGTEGTQGGAQSPASCCFHVAGPSC